MRDMKRGDRFVEADMPASPIPRSCTSIPPSVSNELLVMELPRAQICRHAVRHMGVGEVDIHPAKEVMIHVEAIGVFVVGGNADVFVEVETVAFRKIQAFLLVPESTSRFIDTLHRAAGGQSKDEIGFGVRTAPRSADR